ncbi:HAMP domain-containing sensor histidine kinase [Desulfoscipio sp. XC116]|uniref:HAMP domain-containing sensor histidine kinase n=1 Tax=Desulfoscipio sp. XC116 TaxID=3144975 RepID=UPI00325B8632
MFWPSRKFNLNSLRWRLALSYAIISIVVTALLTGMAVRTSINKSMASQKEKAISSIAGIEAAFSDSLISSLDPAQTARQLGLSAGGRILWLGPDDRVRVDSYGDTSLSGRSLTLPPQLKNAKTANAQIFDTGKTWAAYTTAPLSITDKPLGRLLLIQDLSTLRQEYTQLQQRLWLLGGLFSILLAALGLLLANSMSRPLEDLTQAIERVKAGELNQSVPVTGSLETIALAAAFNNMAARIAGLDEQRRAFIADAAHELRTPLASLQALAEGMNQSSAPRPKELAAFVRQTKRLSRLVCSLLLLARLDNPELQITKVPVMVAGLIEEAIWVIKPLAAERQIKLCIETSKEILIAGDPDWLHRALVNVLSNAVYYTPAGGLIHLRTGVEQDLAYIIIKDSGPGVSPDVLAQLGTRFYRPATARERSSGGTGLGLSIAKEILTLHKGRLEFASPPDQGLIVSMLIPVLPSEILDSDSVTTL